jgi:hypothetical protein
MPFITRVELHGPATGEDYSKLHSAMEGRGFSRTITATDGVTYHLPTAEYYLSRSDLTSQQVLSNAQAADGSVWTRHSELVTQTDAAIRFSGLLRA